MFHSSAKERENCSRVDLFGSFGLKVKSCVDRVCDRSEERTIEDLRRQRDEYYNISPLEKKQQRADLQVKKMTLDNDAWRKLGIAVHFTTSESKMK